MDAKMAFSLMPEGRTFRDLLWPFAIPYFAYVALGSIPSALLSQDGVAIARFLLVSGLLWYFRKEYRFGRPFTLPQAAIALGAAAIALALWVVALRLSLALPFWQSKMSAAQAAEFTPLYLVMRALNSALLVPVFEELFCRAYLQELFHLPPGKGTAGYASLASRLALCWEGHPTPLERPPLSPLAVGAATGLFALGHDPSAWAAAVIYFLFTTWIYARTRSFLTVVAVHGLVNLMIAVLVGWRPELRFLWF